MTFDWSLFGIVATAFVVGTGLTGCVVMALLALWMGVEKIALGLKAKKLAKEWDRKVMAYPRGLKIGDVGP